jgi:tRNA pseudouridine38-40 synthase
MAHYQVILAYDGTDFQGFQRQKSARSVQGEVESALHHLNWNASAIASAGRTDTGAHASGQVIAFELDWPHSEYELGRALNATLPQDVAVRSVKLAPDGFHPRYSATARTYQYHVYCQVDRDPLLERFAWRVWPQAGLELLQDAAQTLVGRHDFSAFGRPPHTGGSTWRVVYTACWQPEDGGLRFEVTANAFLYHMVRRMVYLQVLVGQNQLGLADLAALVQGGAAVEKQTPGIAPAHGLVLVDVQYGEKREPKQAVIRSPEG